MVRRSIALVAVFAAVFVLAQSLDAYGRGVAHVGGRGYIYIRIVFEHPWDDNSVGTPQTSAGSGQTTLVVITGPFGGFLGGTWMWIIRPAQQDKRIEYNHSTGRIEARGASYAETKRRPR